MLAAAMPTHQDASQYDLDYRLKLGNLWANLAVLEFAVRVTLYLLDTPREQRLPPTFKIANLPVGVDIPETWLTGWNYFAPLIEEYNRRCSAIGRVGIDENVGKLRNSLAHGSITAPTVDHPMTLVRYDRPRDGTVRVIEKHVMTLEWLSAQSIRVYDAARTVLQHMEELR